GSLMSRRLLASTVIVVATLIQGSPLTSTPSAQAPGSGAAPQAPPAVPSCPELATALRAVATNDTRLKDWANLGRYREANRTVRGATVVFLGDSITDNWVQPRFGQFFPGKNYVGRGISGQTTPQLLLRMRPDVLALKPKAVIILAGVNDISGLATGPMTNDEIAGNLASMAEVATSNGVKVVLSSIVPTSAYHLQNPNAVPKTTLHPIERIRELNTWIRNYAKEHRYPYADYYSAMVDARGMLREDLSSDDVHPNVAGYAIMAPIAQAAIDQALR
ncbi:MAG: GDSL-type esterase/lipase family protein, partial [Vicinamibacterales bacterium]